MTLKEYIEALELTKIIYESENGLCGGDLHIVLDDDNCDKHSILYCWKQVHTNPFLTGDALVAEKRLLVLMSGFNMAEREAVASKYCWWEYDPDLLKELAADSEGEEDFDPFDLPEMEENP